MGLFGGHSVSRGPDQKYHGVTSSVQLARSHAVSSYKVKYEHIKRDVVGGVHLFVSHSLWFVIT